MRKSRSELGLVGLRTARMGIMRMLLMRARLMDITVRSGFRAVYSLALVRGTDGAGAAATADGMAGATTAPVGMVEDGVVEAGMAAATTAGLDMAMDTMAAATRTRATAEAITAVVAAGSTAVVVAGSTAVAVVEASMAVGVVSTAAAVVDAGS